MQINPTDPVPAVAVPANTHAQDPRPKKPAPDAAHQPEAARTDTTNIVVEIQKNNEVIYKFVDASSGKLIEQIPSEQMINFANAVANAFPSLNKPEGQK